MTASFITKFYAYLLTEKRVAANTFSAYKRDIEQFLQFLEKNNISAENISIADVKSYLKYLKERLGLSARSITRKISALKVLFLYLHEQYGMLNLAEDLTFPKLEKKLPDYLTEDQVRQLLMATEKDTSALGVRNKVLLYMLYATGMRISELIHVQLSHLHFDTGFIDVLGKGGKMRMVPVPQQIVELLKVYIDGTRRTFAAKEQGSQPIDYLFPIFYGGKIKTITRQAVWGILKQLCKKSGIDRSVFPHQLRHSLATHMLKNGADLRSLQLLLGHESLATVQIYTHIETSHLRQVYDKKHPRS